MRIMPRDYRDPTADIAISHVDRERERNPVPVREKKPKEYMPREPVDVERVIHSKHKYVKFNKAWYMYAKFLKNIERDMHEK